MTFAPAPSPDILAADLFCGAGGSSTGLGAALKRLRLRLRLVAVNHWKTAVDTHGANHPDALHFCQDLATLRPRVAVPGGHLHILIASPTCTFHSRARGGRPTSDQQRMDPWHVVTWLTELRVDRIFIENVPEFTKWGPIDPESGQPTREREGEFFQAWIRTLEGIGFQIEWRIQTFSDFGDATTRKRFLLIGRSDGRPLRWPDATHGRPGTPGVKAWRTARDIIDWHRQGRDALGRPQPLRPNTLRRLRVGVLRHFGPLASAYAAALDVEISRSVARWGDATTAKAGRARPNPASETTSPALLDLRGTSAAHGVDQPIPGLTAGGTHLALACPDPTPVARAGAFTLGQQSASAPRSADEPLMTIAGAGAISVIQGFAQPILFHLNHTDDTGRLCDVESPLPTITVRRGMGLAEPMIAPYYGSGSGTTCKSVEAPLDTVTGTARFGLAEPILVQIDQSGGGSGRVRPASRPLPTLVTKRNTALAEPFLSVYNGDKQGRSRASRPIEDPVPAITTEPRMALCQPAPAQLGAGDGDGDLASLALARRLAIIDGQLCVLKLPFRMLANTELARAMSFPEDYVFTGKPVEVTRQIGNAVPVRGVEAHILALFDDLAGEEGRT